MHSIDETGMLVLPDGLTVGGDLDLGRCTGLTSLPAGLTVKGHLDLYRCTGLTALPAGLTVGGDLYLYGCTGLTSLPAGLTVEGYLYLGGCTGLTALPTGLTIRGGLDLSGCTGLTALPDGLTVGGNLNLRGCMGLTALPADIVLGGKRIADAPAIPDIHRAIYAAASREGALDMSDWHTCSTTHCRAGWAVALAGDAGRALEAATRGTGNAAYLIYAASDPARPVVDFYASNTDALADMKRRAEETNA
jgi:hypothetical protein